MPLSAKKTVVLYLMPLALTGCDRLGDIDYSPKVTPDAFLQSQPWMDVRLGDFNFIWSQPSSSLIVFFVALYTIFKGYKFLSNTQDQRAKFWWGIGLLLTGIGAVFAGISYQALGYEIKCHGREFCTFTSEWEVAYMLLSALGMGAFVLAAAYTNAKGNFRKAMIASALLGVTTYLCFLFYGISGAIQWLVAFEFMAAFSAVAVVFFIVLHGLAWFLKRDSMNRSLLIVWLVFVAVFVAYGLFPSLGITKALWSKGIWFNENDLLHVGMILWIYVVGKHLPTQLVDQPG
ncbi:MAG: hypothetical protein KA293_08050 [Bacteroidia bacterium]|nr:hypothetical protein [Bacteroidia bacterium]